MNATHPCLNASSAGAAPTPKQPSSASTRTAEHADIHLAPVPGTDLLLLNAMAQVICAEGLYDEHFVGRHVRFSDGDKTVDLAAFQEFLKRYTPEAVEAELGIAAEQIRTTAFRFARSRATMSLWTMGINQRTQGVFLNNMLNGLHLFTGQIGRPGATPFSLTGQSNACGGVRDTGALAHLLPNGRQVTNPQHRAEVEDLWGVPQGTLSSAPGYDAISLFRAMEEEKIKAALVMCTNPAQSLPAAKRYRSAMEKCFLAVAEVVEDSETAKLADVLLPAALWVEKEGVYGQGERRYQLIEKLLEPPGQCRSDLQILVDLADRLGHGQLIKARAAAPGTWPALALPHRGPSWYAAPLRRGDRSLRRTRQRHGVLWQPRQEGRLFTCGRTSPAPSVPRRNTRCS